MTYMTKYLFVTLFFLQSCAFIDYREVPALLWSSITGPEELIVDEGFQEEMEYSFIRARIGDSYAIMTLLSSDNEIFEWVSADKQRIYTYNGRVIKTSGLTFNSQLLGITEDSDLISPQERVIQLSNPHAIFTQHISQKTIDDESLSTIIESFITQGYRWKGQNSYSIDKKNGLPSHTIQAIHPNFKQLEINFYYKY